METAKHAAGLPFAGLGFDLAPVAARAGAMRVRRILKARPLIECRPVSGRPIAYGYALQVMLGRECCGS